MTILHVHPDRDGQPDEKGGAEPALKFVVIVSRDAGFREALREAVATPERCVLAGEDQSVFAQITGWLAEWRELEGVEAVVIDLGDDILGGVDALDAIRRRDANTFVILLARAFGTPGVSRLGANLILEGKVEPSVVADALANQSARNARK